MSSLCSTVFCFHFMCIKETIQLKTIKELIRQIQRCHYKKGGDTILPKRVVFVNYVALKQHLK